MTTLAQGTPGTPGRRADECLVLTLAHQRLGETDQVRRAYRQAAAAANLPGENVLLRDLVLAALRDDLLPAALPEAGRPDAREAEDMLAAAVGELPDTVADAVRKHPDQADGYLARGDWFGRRGLWRRAADDFAECRRSASAGKVHRNAAGDPARLHRGG